jgi:hypothetical protein
LLSRSHNQIVQIDRNHDQIASERSALTREFGFIEAIVRRLGKNPYRSDVGGGPYPVYDVALSTDVLQRRGPCIDAALQDMEFILGKLDSMSVDEFERVSSPPAVVVPSTTHPISNPSISAGGNISAGGDIIVGSHHNRTTSPADNSAARRIILEIVGAVVAAGIVYYLGWK